MYSYGCNHTPTLIYAINDAYFYGSDASNVSDFDGDLVINLTGISNVPQSLVAIPELAKHLNVKYKEIMVPWADMSAPKVEPEFWRSLNKYIKDSNYTKVCFHCQAGHGRTGTALAAMIVANVGYTVEDAVLYVREEYCEEAVESYTQMAYLRLLDEYYNGNKFEGNINDSEVKPSMVYKSKYLDNKPYSSYWSKKDDDDNTKNIVSGMNEMGVEIEDDEEENKIIFD